MNFRLCNFAKISVTFPFKFDSFWTNLVNLFDKISLERVFDIVHDKIHNGFGHRVLNIFADYLKKVVKIRNPKKLIFHELQRLRVVSVKTKGRKIDFSSNCIAEFSARFFIIILNFILKPIRESKMHETISWANLSIFFIYDSI